MVIKNDMASHCSETLTLYPSRRKSILRLAGTASFVALGVVVLAKQDNSTAMWFCVSFFAICVLIFFVFLLPGSASLTLNMNCFRIKTLYFVRKSKWQNVTNIHAASEPISGLQLVRYNDTQWNGWKLAKWETSRLGYNAALPDTYGMSADDLAELINRWRDRALRTSSQLGEGA